jgi:hypothetical protein
MKPSETIAGFCARVQDMVARTAVIKADATSLAVDVAIYATDMERTMPQSDTRDEVIGALASLKRMLVELGAIPPADISALPKMNHP